MIILCNGLPKSGSSFVFQIADSLAESVGFNQKRLRAQFVPNRFVPFGPHPHFVVLGEGGVVDLIEQVPESILLVVKTHDQITPQTIELLSRDKVRVINTYREPRDAAVSLWEAGMKEKETVDRALWRFAGVYSLQDAIMIIGDRLTNTMKWMDNPDVLNICFDSISGDPFDVGEQIADYLGIDINLLPVISKYLINRRRILEYNMGIAGRHITHMNLFQEGFCSQLYKQYDEISAPTGQGM